MILVAYDGSADARAAIDHAAVLMPGADTVVLTVWEPLLEVLLRSGSLATGFGTTGFTGDCTGVDRAAEAAALATAQEGAARAAAHGLAAVPRCSADHGGLAHTIVTAAAELGAGAVVMGTRGLGGVRSLLLGSVSRGVLEHAGCPVLIVPPHVHLAVVEDRGRRGAAVPA